MNQVRHTLVFAHRGANREAPENTRSAFDRALAYPIDGIETDIQLSRDEVAVLWHDRYIAKLGHPASHVDDFDYEQLRAMKTTHHFATTANSEVMMTLQEFLQFYRQRTRLILEIKNREWELPARHENKVQQTLSMVGQVSDERILISSFNLTSLTFANRHRPGFPLVYNFEEEQTLEDARQVLSVHTFLHGLCLPIASLSKEMVELLRDLNKSITVYTCNSDEEINLALAMGVDILISDLPEKALGLRDSRFGLREINS